MAQIETTLTIAATPEAVFAAMTTPAEWSAWMHGLQRVEVLTEGAFAEGTRWRETRKMFGKEAVELFEVRALEAPRRAVFWVDGAQGSSGKGEFEFEYLLTPISQGTRLVVRGEIRMPGAISRLFASLFKGVFKKACDRDLVALKAWLEAPAAPRD